MPNRSGRAAILATDLCKAADGNDPGTLNKLFCTYAEDNPAYRDCARSKTVREKQGYFFDSS